MALAVIFLIPAALSGADKRPAARAAGGQTVVLDSAGFWRMHHTLKPPLIDLPGVGKPALMLQRWLNTETAEPPANWPAADFDDVDWPRGPGRMAMNSPYLSRLCVRGKFMVTDPAKVGPLTLSVDYHGGAIVYLNGKEVTRRHVAAGADGRTALAEAYPLEAFVSETGELLAKYGQYIAAGKRMGTNTPEATRRLGLSKRSLADLVLPHEMLRQGVNVLALEIIRAPYPKIMEDLKQDIINNKKLPPYQLRWNTCELEAVRLTASSDAGLAVTTSPPPGVQIWNGDPLAADFTADFGDPCEKLRPVSIVAARNGNFSGKVIVGSDKPIRGLTVTASDLRSGSTTIPAAAVQIRYGLPWGSVHGSGGREKGALLDAVAEVPLKEFPAASGGAVVPLWITVKPGKEVAAGTYTGTITVAANGETPVKAAVTVKVVDFTLAAPQNYRTVVELIESPDTLSLEYGEPLWSDRHFAMIADSFRLISSTGARVVHVPVIAHTNLGNAESMVRWIKKGPAQYDFDFSIMDKYLDAAKKNLGDPKVLVLQVWDLYMSTKDSAGKRFGEVLAEKQKISGGCPQITLLDPATGKTENGIAPDLIDPASKAIWKKLIGEVRRHLAERGMEKALMFGMFTDALPSKEQIQFFHDLAPEVPWVQEGHGRWATKIYGLSEVGFQGSVWGVHFADGQEPKQTVTTSLPVESLQGWKWPRVDLVFERNTSLDSYPVSRWRFYAETAVTGDLRGLGRIGADYWQAIRDKQGRRAGHACDRFPEGSWGGNNLQLNLCSAVLAPGPTGPVATTRLLALAEGVQDCEARIVIEQALTDEALKARLGPELAKRCQEALNGRLDFIWKSLSNLDLAEPFGATAWRWSPGIDGHTWYLGTDRRKQTETLYGLAGEVTRKLGGK
jgi:hypothetical protein